MDVNQYKSATNLDDLWHLLHQDLSSYGISSVFYGFTYAFKLVGTKPNKELMYYRSSHPAKLDEYYQDKQLHYINDSLPVLHCATETTPFFWYHKKSWEKATGLQLQMREVNKSLGMVVGVSLPMRFGKSGIGGFGLASTDLNSDEFDQMWQNKHQDITKIIETFDKYARKNHIDQMYQLTTREKQVLELCAMGFNTGKIASQLGNAPSTVEKQLRSARAKLKASNTEQAISMALILELISL